MLIGKSGSMITALSPDQCGERLRNVMRKFLWGSRADASGFKLARGSRTVIRIRGAFAPQQAGGTLVTYRIEPLPVAVVSLAVAFPLSLVVIISMLVLTHQSLSILLWLVPIVAIVGAANVWISDIQARRLIRILKSELDAS